MNKNKYLDTGILFGLVLVFLMSCASIKPVNKEFVISQGLLDDLDGFKIYQYFVSRDIVLTATEVDVQTDVRRGQAITNTRAHREVIQLLASTPGKCLAIESPDNSLKLGIEFDAGSNNLLWFYYDEDGYFYLDYTNRSKREIVYAGTTYQITYEKATGLDATYRRLTTLKKAHEDYQNMEPLLLYEGKGSRQQTESKRTLGGSRL